MILSLLFYFSTIFESFLSKCLALKLILVFSLKFLKSTVMKVVAGRGVQPAALRLHVAQMAMSVAQHKIINLLKTL